MVLSGSAPPARITRECCALHEAGVRTDLVAGRGMGAASAMFAAVDGGARLWDQNRHLGSRASRFYQWRIARAAGGALIAAGAVLLFSLLLLQPPWLRVSPAWSSRSSVSSAGSALGIGFTSRLAQWFEPQALPTIIPRLVLLGGIGRDGCAGHQFLRAVGAWPQATPNAPRCAVASDRQSADIGADDRVVRVRAVVFDSRCRAFAAAVDAERAAATWSC